MQPTELGQAFDPHLYNALMSVDAADKTVRSASRLGEFLDAAATLFVNHQMHTRFGVALLHQHSKVAPGEYMIEYGDVHEQSDVLITRPVTRTPEEEEAVPSVWAISDGAFCPLEFTTDPLARDLLCDGDIPARFLEEFTALTQSSPVGNLLGLAIVARAFYRGAKPNEVALEYSNLLERSNVVFLSDRTASEGKAIETAWTFKPAIEASARCVDTRECIKICHQGDGGHSGQAVHTPGPGEHMPT
jgi:hypothetical protein